MAKRSLKASTIGMAKAKQAFERTGWTQEDLAAEVGLSTRQSVWKFFTGRPVARSVFQEICFRLNLEWEDIVERPQGLGMATATEAATTVPADLGAPELANILRDRLRDRLQSRCGKVSASLETSQPLPLAQVYTELQVRARPNQQRWLEVDDLRARVPRRERPTLSNELGETIQPAMVAVARCPQLAILGKPGAGKTTLLQHIALECSAGRYRSDCVPAWIELRTFAANSDEDVPDLLDFLNIAWSDCGIDRTCLETLARAGKLLLLLDGFDEISGDLALTVAAQIQTIVETYPQTPIVLTCRSGLQEYRFRGFTYVELVDFGPTQIASFAHRWFAATAIDTTSAASQTEAFLAQIDRRENQPIRELIATPLLLGLICAVFQERSTFPRKRAKLYQTGLDILLVRWDRARGIQRERAYRALSLADKIKLLSQIAWQACERGEYFFEKTNLVQTIGDYLQSLPAAIDAKSSEDLETLWLDSEAILNAIVVQHGLLVERAREIYSFSHITFQEYFAARRIVALSNPDILDRTLRDLSACIGEARWREVIALTASMLSDADKFCQQIAACIDRSLADNPTLQALLHQIQAKVARLGATSHVPAAMRAFYLSFYLDRDLSLAAILDSTVAARPAPDLGLDLALVRILGIARALAAEADLTRLRSQLLDLHFALDLDARFALDEALAGELGHLRETLVEPNRTPEDLARWWETTGIEWQAKLQKILSDLRHLPGLDALTLAEQEQLDAYIDANRFLCNCLSGDAQVSEAVREALKHARLLPVSTEVAPEGSSGHAS